MCEHVTSSLEQVNISAIVPSLYLSSTSALDSALALDLLRVTAVVTVSTTQERETTSDAIAHHSVDPAKPLVVQLRDAVNFMRDHPCVLVPPLRIEPTIS